MRKKRSYDNLHERVIFGLPKEYVDIADKMYQLDSYEDLVEWTSHQPINKRQIIRSLYIISMHEQLEHVVNGDVEYIGDPKKDQFVNEVRTKVSAICDSEYNKLIERLKNSGSTVAAKKKRIKKEK